MQAVLNRRRFLGTSAFAAVASSVVPMQAQAQSGDFYPGAFNRYNLPLPVWVENNSPLRGQGIVVDQYNRHLYFIDEGRALKFIIGVGKKGLKLPSSRMRILQKVLLPAWENPITHRVIPANSAGNPMGVCALTLLNLSTGQESDSAIHGVALNGAQGLAANGEVSHGCFRMANWDIYYHLFPRVEEGMPVRIQAENGFQLNIGRVIEPVAQLNKSFNLSYQYGHRNV